ncbi:MAG: DUF5397 family protein [Roseimicrobium sp.]
MKTLARTVDDLIGTYRTFGPYGPLYEVKSKISETLVHVVVIESNEELDYATERALNDPEAD